MLQAAVVVAMGLVGAVVVVGGGGGVVRVVSIHRLTAAVLAQATISGLWNAAYAVGWAAGPFLGGLLHDV